MRLVVLVHRFNRHIYMSHSREATVSYLWIIRLTVVD